MGSSEKSPSLLSTWVKACLYSEKQEKQHRHQTVAANQSICTKQWLPLPPCKAGIPPHLSSSTLHPHTLPQL